MEVRSASFNPPKFYFPLNPLQGLLEHAHKSSINVADSTLSSSDAAGNYVSRQYLLRTASVALPRPEASDSKCIRFDFAADSCERRAQAGAAAHFHDARHWRAMSTNGC